MGYLFTITIDLHIFFPPLVMGLVQLLDIQSMRDN